ncbi:rhodanese-like domain-containing protein [Crocinitomicaceae bacterium]|nr:rhodanese-like domain-containing protein [Crocinitomicaceae bacterium]
MRYLFLFVTLMTFTAYGQSKEYRAMLKKYYSADFPTISISDAKAKIGQSNVYFLDTREKEEFNVSHIKTALQVGYDDFSLSSVSKLPKDAEIIVYCSIGARSQTIGQKLIEDGFTNVKNLYGGMFHWANNSYPMRDNSGEKTTTIHGYSEDWGKWVYRGTVVY